MRDEKLHAVVARSTFRSQNVQNTPFSDHFWKLRCRKSARGCGAKHIPKSKCIKHTSFGPLLEVAMSKKCTSLWREAHFEVKMYKKPPGVRTTFGRSDVVSRGRRKGLCTFSKVSKSFVAFPKTMAGVGHLKRICKDAFCVAGAVQKTCSSEMLGGQERGCILEHCQIQKFNKSRRIASFWMLLSSKNEEVSQNCCVFDVVNFEQ